jgi:uncharacterized membrane protein YeiH
MSQNVASVLLRKQSYGIQRQTAYSHASRIDSEILNETYYSKTLIVADRGGLTIFQTIGTQLAVKLSAAH